MPCDGPSLPRSSLLFFFARWLQSVAAVDFPARVSRLRSLTFGPEDPIFYIPPQHFLDVASEHVHQPGLARW